LKPGTQDVKLTAIVLFIDCDFRDPQNDTGYRSNSYTLPYT